MGELQDILGMTVKHDNENKLITFLAMLSAYTENSQLNVGYRAPSSTGKSYIPLELAQLFPQEDVIEIAYASPSSFWHDRGFWDEDRKCLVVDLERKILIFVDQPHDMVLQRLRPLLSHDKKELQYKITDKAEKRGLRTKNVVIRGFTSVIFCTGSLKTDEQEATRMILLSPETTQEKLKEAVLMKIGKESDPQHYMNWLQQDERREMLKQRILAIKNANIKNIVIRGTEEITDRFFKKYPRLQPRHTRDIGKIFSLAKSLALLNHWYRERDLDENLIVSKEDIDIAFRLWDKISVSQELGIPPYILNLYKEVVVPAYNEEYENFKIRNSEEIEKFVGISRNAIIKKHFEVYGRSIPDWQLRQEIIPSLESAGLITQEHDPQDKRRKLIVVTPRSNSLYLSQENYSESRGGVEIQTRLDT